MTFTPSLRHAKRAVIGEFRSDLPIFGTFPQVFCFRKSCIKENGGSFVIVVLIGTHKSLNEAMIVSARQNYQPLCYGGHPELLDIISQEMMD